MNSTVLLSKLSDFKEFLRDRERSANTIVKYNRDLEAFFIYLGSRELCKEAALAWKESLTGSYAPSSVNSMLAALNSFLDWLELPQCKVKPIKIQRAIFTRPEKELTREEYERLIQAADRKHNNRLSMLLQTICATGIRVSELPFITVEAAHTCRAVVDCKGKTRTVFLPNDLCQSLKNYCKEQGIKKGIIFVTKNGRTINRTNIWRDMKALCESAGVEPGKVFPHNLRHLFAKTYYGLEKDLSRLADLLGHSNVSTTRIYTMESGMEHIRQLERMGLVFSREQKTT